MRPSRLGGVCGFALLIGAPWARANGPLFKCPDNDISVGPSIAYGWPEQLQSGPLYGIDLTYMPFCYGWVSGGARFLGTQSELNAGLLPYAEVGLYLLLVNVGVGYTWAQGPTHHHGPHLFVGLPLPLDFKGNSTEFLEHTFFEPYYRVSYISDDAQNELGLLVKWTTLDLFGRSRRRMSATPPARK